MKSESLERKNIGTVMKAFVEHLRASEPVTTSLICGGVVLVIGALVTMAGIACATGWGGAEASNIPSFAMVVGAGMTLSGMVISTMDMFREYKTTFGDVFDIGVRYLRQAIIVGAVGGLLTIAFKGVMQNAPVPSWRFLLGWLIVWATIEGYRWTQAKWPLNGKSERR